MDPARELGLVVAVTLGLYVVVILALAFFARSKLEGVDDFLVAGRRLSLPLSWATLLATWFGAGTLLTSADEVRAEGLKAAALEPFGAGTCLLLAGLFFAGPLWRMQLLTLADFYRVRFGRRAELIAAVTMTPSYFGWTAAQFLALAGLLHLFTGLDPNWGIFLVAAVGTVCTVAGGMWSVTLTDALQVGLLLVGLVTLAVATAAEVSVATVWRKTPADLRTVIPTTTTSQFVEWLGVFAVAALGNLPGQELMQRVFSARSARIARQACLLAGLTYLSIGLVPVYLALASRVVLPNAPDASILPALASAFFSPTMTVIFTVVLASAVLSTIDSAMLAPSSLMAQNIIRPMTGDRISPLALNRGAVLVTAAASTAMAYLGEDAYSLLEESYSMTLVGLLVPLAMGLWRTPRSERPAVACMLTGSGVWLFHLIIGWQTFGGPWLARAALPVALSCMCVGLVVYVIVDHADAASTAT